MQHHPILSTLKYRHPDKTFLYEHDLMSSSYLHGGAVETLSSTGAIVWSGIFILIIGAATLFNYQSPEPSSAQKTALVQVADSVKK